MAGTEFRVSTASNLTLNSGTENAISIGAHASIGFLVYRVSVEFQSLGDETGKAFIEIVRSDAHTNVGGVADKISLSGDSDDPSMTCRHFPGGLSNEVAIAHKYWPITTTSPCTFDFGGLTRLKVNGGKVLAVKVTGPAGAATTQYNVTIDGTE